MDATMPDYADNAVVPKEGGVFPDYGDLLDAPQPEPARAREGLVRNVDDMPCRSCGLVHPYWTGTLKLADGEEYCGVPVLFCGSWPVMPSLPDERIAAPEHGMQVLIPGDRGLRLGIVWCPERAAGS